MNLFDHLMIHAVKHPEATATDLVDVIAAVQGPTDPAAARSLANRILKLADLARTRAAQTAAIIDRALAGYPDNRYPAPVITGAAHHTSGDRSYWTRDEATK